MYAGIDAFAVNCVLYSIACRSRKKKLQQFQTTSLRDSCLHYRFIFVKKLFDVTITP